MANVWMPNWQYDVVCASSAVADQIDERFHVGLARSVRLASTRRGSGN
jgi:hypothetical protein